MIWTPPPYFIYNLTYILYIYMQRYIDIQVFPPVRLIFLLNPKQHVQVTFLPRWINNLVRMRPPFFFFKLLVLHHMAP